LLIPLGRRRFDDLENYSNDRSIYLAQLRDRIEEPWQAWELSHMPVAEYKQLSPAQVTFGRRSSLDQLNMLNKVRPVAGCCVSSDHTHSCHMFSFVSQGAHMDNRSRLLPYSAYLHPSAAPFGLCHWLLSQCVCRKPLQIKERLQEGYKVDVDPPLSDSARYMREDMSLQGYRHLLAVGAPHVAPFCAFRTFCNHAMCTDALEQCTAVAWEV
jgi:hypothetical protein